MIHVEERCTGCRTCQLVCSLFHSGQSYPSLARVIMHSDELRMRAEFAPDCDECARCAKFCPYGAMNRGE